MRVARKNYPTMPHDAKDQNSWSASDQRLGASQENHIVLSYNLQAFARFSRKVFARLSLSFRQWIAMRGLFSTGTFLDAFRHVGTRLDTFGGFRTRTEALGRVQTFSENFGNSIENFVFPDFGEVLEEQEAN